MLSIFLSYFSFIWLIVFPSFLIIVCSRRNQGESERSKKNSNIKSNENVKPIDRKETLSKSVEKIGKNKATKSSTEDVTEKWSESGSILTNRDLRKENLKSVMKDNHENIYICPECVEKKLIVDKSSTRAAFSNFQKKDAELSEDKIREKSTESTQSNSYRASHKVKLQYVCPECDQIKLNNNGIHKEEVASIIKTKQRIQQTAQPKTQQQSVEYNGSAELKVNPIELRWKELGGIQTIQLTNPSTTRQVIKAKCSDNTLYRVNPVFSFINPGETVNIDILRKAGETKVDKLIFLTAKATPDAKNPEALFKERTDKLATELLLLSETY